MPYVVTLIAIWLLVPPEVSPGAFEYPNDLARWVSSKPPNPWLETEAPELGDARLDAAEADADHDWFVYVRAGRPSARLMSFKDPPRPPLPFEIEKGDFREGLSGKRLNVKVEDGWLVSFNAGEWGGHLWWFSPDGSRRYKISSDCWVNGFIPTEIGLLALEGISHGQTQGRMIRLLRDGEGRWLSKTLISLGEEPHAAAKDSDGTLIAVTHHRLLRIDPSTKKVDILINDFWGSDLYPNSLITSGSCIFIGMRHGVAKIERRGKRYRTDWLLPMPEFDRMTNSRDRVMRSRHGGFR